MASNPGLNVALTTGVAALLGGYAAWKLQKEYKKLEENKKKNLSEVVHLIKIEDIGKLLDSDNVEVRRAAEKVLLQKAGSSEYFHTILNCCLSEDKEIVVKAVTSVFLLCKATNQNKQFLLSENGLKTLSKVIENISDGYQYKALVENCKKDIIVEKILMRVIGSIFHLTLNDTLVAMELSKEKGCVRDVLLHVLSDHGFHILTDVKRWSTYIIHQLVQSDTSTVKKSLRKWGVITKATLCLIRTLGDILMTQLCLQILVQYLNDTVDEIVQVCQEMASLGLLPHLVGLLRCEEEENIIQLSAIIIHHFCCFDIDVRNMCKIPGIVKILFTVLNSNEASIQKTILRVYNYLSVSSSSFQKKLLNNQPLLKRLSICLASGNREVVQGSLMLIHDLAMPGKQAAQKIVNGNPDILKSLVTLTMSSSGEAAQLIAETLGFFCSCEALHSVILKQGVINAILHFAKSPDTSVQFWASALLLNLSMISDEIKNAIIRNGGMFILLEMAVSGDESDMPDIASNATKAMVILGFLEETIDVRLSAGLDGSIIIDGTEYCPGKQGINIVSLDFIRYKYSKGKVLQPNKLADYMADNYVDAFKKWDPVFIVTQGDCTVFSEEAGAEIPNAFKQMIPTENFEEFVKSPVWALCFEPRNTKIMCGSDNLDLHLDLPLEHCVSSLLKDNFTEPLIDVLLSYSPTSSVNKTEDLNLIEILARHSFQRKVIVTTAGFLEYLYEMLWSVVSLKVENLRDPENATKLSHCSSALRILHLCSIDKNSLVDLLDSTLLRVLLCLLLSLNRAVQSNSSQNVFNFSRQNSRLGIGGLEREQKQVWSDLKEESYEEQKKEHHDAEEDMLSSSGYFRGSQFDTVTASNDNIFYETDEDTATTSKAVHFDVSESQQQDDTSQRPLGRMRADSYIVRADTLNRQRSESRSNLSFLDQSSSQAEAVDAEEGPSTSTTPSITPSRGITTKSDAANHQQLRRISRSMSTSMQLSKTNNDNDKATLPNTDEVFKQLTKHSIMIVYHILSRANETTWSKVLTLHYIPILMNTLSLFEENFKEEIGLPISASLIDCQKFLQDNTQDTMQRVEHACMNHVSFPHSLILSADQLSVSNENWFFESVCGNQEVTSSLGTDIGKRVPGWYYEVIIHTSGIMQIGWANEDCLYNPEKGIGVGDTINSCGFDGTRKKVWSGPSRELGIDNDYGINWQSGDVLSVLLSWGGVLSFWLNGKDLGPALSNVDTSKIWRPAASLSVDQRCTFVFRAKDMKHKEETDYVTISEVYDASHQHQPRVIQEPHPVDVLSGKDFIKPDTTPLTAYFFEVDLSSLTDVTVVTIGYIYNHGNKNNIKEVGSASSSSILNVYKKILKNVDVSSWLDNPDKRMKVMGCGIVLQRKSMVITCGPEVLCELQLAELFGSVEFKDEMVLKLIPYFSIANVPINFGQHSFTFDPANSILSKQKFTTLVLDFLDKEDP